jgi:hypothetical protein
MLPRIAVLFVLCLVASLTSSRAADEPAGPFACPVAEDFAMPDAPLLHVAAAIAAGRPVNILAVGTASTVGLTRHAETVESFPYRMVEALHAARPRATFNLTVRGGHGMTADTMLPLIVEALASQRYQLVIWQTGTVEAVRGEAPDAMEAALEAGAQRVADAGGDLVLVDSQFSRFLRANVDLDPYETVLQQVATMQGVVLFHRYDLMNAWVDGDVIDLERTPRIGRDKVIARLGVCIGNALAHFVLNGAALDSATASQH